MKSKTFLLHETTTLLFFTCNDTSVRKNNHASSMKFDVTTIFLSLHETTNSVYFTKNNYTPFLSLTSLSPRAPFTHSHSILTTSTQHVLHTCFLGLLHLPCTRLRLLVPRFLSLLLSTLLLTCSASLACMYTLHACSASCFHYVHAFLLYLYSSSRASWLHAYST